MEKNRGNTPESDLTGGAPGSEEEAQPVLSALDPQSILAVDESGADPEFEQEVAQVCEERAFELALLHLRTEAQEIQVVGGLEQVAGEVRLRAGQRSLEVRNRPSLARRGPSRSGERERRGSICARSPWFPSPPFPAGRGSRGRCRVVGSVACDDSAPRGADNAKSAMRIAAPFPRLITEPPATRPTVLDQGGTGQSAFRPEKKCSCYDCQTCNLTPGLSAY